MKVLTKDLQVGKEYWLDNSKQVSGVVILKEEETNTIFFDPVEGQEKRYFTDPKGRIIFPLDFDYQYLQVEV